MSPFELARPTTLREAAEMLAGEPGRHVALAGGQDLLSTLKDRILEPERVVNLKSLPGLRSIETKDGALSVGALVTLAELAASDVVRRGWPVLAQAAGEAASPQIRNLGTVGGNLCQQPRCWYFRSGPLRCARRGGDECLAVSGDNRYHSIFTYGTCIAPNLSSLATPLAALGASVQTSGAGLQRTLSISELYAALRDRPTADTSLEPSEIITGVTVPPAAGWRTAHEEVRHKASFDWPLALCTVALAVDGGDVREARIALGALAPVPWLSEPAAAALVGRPVTPESAAAAAEAAVREATPFEHNGYKVTIARHLIRRTILAAGQGGS